MKQRQEPSIGNNQAAHFVAIMGATGCGKSTELKKRLALKPRPRILVWSPKEAIDNYAAMVGGVVVSSVSQVLDIIGKAGKKGRFKVVFKPSLSREKDTKQFDVFCKIALAAGNLTMIAEELHTVTTPTHAPDGWAKLNFMGRAYGVEVFGLSQRPASVDKSFMGSLSAVHCGRLPFPEDQKTMARTMGVSHADVSMLIGYQAIQKDFNTGKIAYVN